jgi:hypothetical protein
METIIEIKKCDVFTHNYVLLVNNRYIYSDEQSMVESYARRLWQAIPNSQLIGYPHSLLYCPRD